MLKKLDAKRIGAAQIRAALEEVSAGIDVDKIYAENYALFEGAIQRGLDAMLSVYNNKGLVAEVASILELGHRAYEKLVIRMLGSRDRELVIASLKNYVPSLEIQ